jgi:hypothetical protein
VDKELIDRFRKIASQNGVIYIGWGISKEKRNEDRQPPDHLIETLKGIKNAKGEPALFIHWIGNHHNKEIVVDESVHLLGSFNWLSYRGDYSLRSESVTKVTNREIVQEELSYLESRFIERIKEKYKHFDYKMKVAAVYELLGLSTYKESEEGIIDELFEETFTLTEDRVLFDMCSKLVNENCFIPTLKTALHYLALNHKEEKKINKLINQVKKELPGFVEV